MNKRYAIATGFVIVLIIIIIFGIRWIWDQGYLGALDTQNVIALQPRSTDMSNEGKAAEIKVYDPNIPFVKPDDQVLLNQLSDESFVVTQRGGTETPFENAYWDNKEKGLYVDIVSGEPLFASTHMFDSGTGWPSFWRPLESETIKVIDTEIDIILGYEVKSAQADSHLGHVFIDGPDPTGLRFCINSAALRFVPYDQMEQLGYGDYTKYFDKE